MKHVINNKFINLYVNFLNKFLNPQKSIKVIFDCSNGSTGPVLEKLLKAKSLKLTAKIINGAPNGNFPAHSPDPLEPNAIRQLQKEVLKNRADLGIIFDGDGDRVVFIDNKGLRVDPDIISKLIIWETKPQKVVVEISTSWLIKKLKGLKIIKSPVGHYFIKKIMRRNKADLGTERSGHYYFKNFFYTDSGILAAIHIINAVSKLPYKLSDFVSLSPKYFRKEINIKITNLESLAKKINKYYSKSTNISKIDGLTVEFNNWWFNIRPSNTEPLTRINIESLSQKVLNSKVKELRRLLAD